MQKSEFKNCMFVLNLCVFKLDLFVPFSGWGGGGNGSEELVTSCLSIVSYIYINILRSLGLGKVVEPCRGYMRCYVLLFSHQYKNYIYKS